MATQSASRACLTLTISRLPGRYGAVEALGDHAVEARALERVQPLRAQLGVLGGAGDMAPLLFVHRLRQRLSTDAERLLQSDVSPVASASKPMKCAGVSSESILMRLAAGWMR